MFVTKGNQREVEAIQDSRGVRIVINGIVVLRFANDDDRVIFVGGVSTEITGLAVTGDTNHPQYVWDSDKANSKSY
jgi:hypothetical protein